MDVHLAPDTPGLSRPMSALTRWVGRVGPFRVTLILTAFVSVASLLLTWAALLLAGYRTLGSAWWISLVVPIPLTVLFGGISTYLLTALDRARSQIQEVAMLDPLTGLYNRRRFLIDARRELDLAARHTQPLAVMMLDVDHFKSINDAHGHAVGDQVLIEVGRRCHAALRATDIIARWGGEEFIALLPNTPVQQAELLAERVRQRVSASAQVQLRDRSVRVTVSVGAAGTEAGHRQALEDLVRRADNELYKAKRNGRDRVSMSTLMAAALASALPAPSDSVQT